MNCNRFCNIFTSVLDPLVRGMDPDPDPDPSIRKKNSKKTLIPTVL
jgi:hypothetical protein